MIYFAIHVTNSRHGEERTIQGNTISQEHCGSINCTFVEALQMIVFNLLPKKLLSTETIDLP